MLLTRMVTCERRAGITEPSFTTITRLPTRSSEGFVIAGVISKKKTNEYVSIKSDNRGSGLLVLKYFYIFAPNTHCALALLEKSKYHLVWL